MKDFLIGDLRSIHMLFTTTKPDELSEWLLNILPELN
jgi:hypothetical protein